MSRPTLPDPDNARRIAAVAVRRRLRAVRDSPGQLVSLAITGLLALLAVAGLTFGAYIGGRAVRTGRVAAPLDTAGVVAAGLLFGVAGFVSFRRIQTSRLPDGSAGLLTTVPARDLHAGLVAVELFWTFVYIGPVALLCGLALAAGARSVAVFPGLVVALLGLATLGVVVGYGLGLAVRTLFVRSALLARHRTAIGVGTFVVYMLLLVSNRVGDLTVPFLRAVSGPPLSWFGHVALVGLGGDPLRAAGALVFFVVVSPALLLGSQQIAAYLWYTDPPERTEGDDSEARFGTLSDGRSLSPGTLLTDALERLSDRPTARVAAKSWLRARRAPLKLVFVAYPLFGLLQPLADTVRTGEVSPFLLPFLALYGAWATGAAFTLNPLGDEGAVLPVTLTTGVGGRGFVRGLVFAGAAIGVPLTVLLVLVSGLFGSLSPSVVVAFTGLGALLALCAPALATGFGVAFPRFDAVRVVRSRRATVPSLWAFATYSLVLLVVAAPGLALATPPLTALVASAVGVGRRLVLSAGVAATGLFVAVAAAVSYRLAAGRVGGYTLE